MPLLYIAQREGGYVNKHDIEDIAEICGITTSEVASIIGFYTLYHDKPEGKIRIQVCNDLPCALRGADEFLENLCENVGIKVGETTEDGLVPEQALYRVRIAGGRPFAARAGHRLRDRAQPGRGYHHPGPRTNQRQAGELFSSRHAAAACAA